MGGHNATESVCQGHKGYKITLTELRPVAMINWRFQVAVGKNPTVAGKMFPRGSHARLIHTLYKSASYISYQLRLITKGTITDNTAGVAINIQHRCKANIQTTGNHLSRHQPTAVTG